MAELRPTIADILTGLAVVDPLAVVADPRLCRMLDGAETLLWAHDNETIPRGDEMAELEELREGAEDLAKLRTFAEAVVEEMSNSAHTAAAKVSHVKGLIEALP